MILGFIFKRLSLSKQIAYLRNKGVLLGTRQKNKRKIYVYMLSNLFIEVFFRDDDNDNDAEKITILSGLDHLKKYLENEFKASF